MASGIRLRDEVYADPYYELYLNGSKVDTYYQRFITSVEFEESDTEADLVRISVDDYNFEFSRRFQLTKRNSVRLIMGFSTLNRAMFEGEITHIEADFGDDGVPKKVIGAVDSTNKMNAVKKSRKWKNKKSSDIAMQIAKEHGFTPVIQATTDVIEEITQENETDAQLLNKLAEDEAFLVYRVPETNKLYFGSRFHGIGGAKEIHYNSGDNTVISFQPDFVEKNKEDRTSDKEGDVSTNTKKPVIRNSKKSAKPSKKSKAVKSSKPSKQSKPTAKPSKPVPKSVAKTTGISVITGKVRR